MSRPNTNTWPLSAKSLSGDEAQQRRLARAARSHDRRDEAAAHTDVEPGKDRPPVDGVMHIAHVDHRVICRSGRRVLERAGLLKRPGFPSQGCSGRWSQGR